MNQKKADSPNKKSHSKKKHIKNAKSQANII